MLDGLVTAIVRPLRAEYSSLELGPPRLRYGELEYQRNDFIVSNSRGLQIQGSYWSIINSNMYNTDSCIIYLHPNSGSRIDVIKNARIMSIAAHIHCNVCSFDFSGCGESGGDCISLGVREKEDVCAVLSHLLSCGCRRFILWGRSMGAATALMFYGAYKELLVGTVIALILDSPFTSLQGLATQFTLTRSVPGLILAPALQYIRHSILSLHGFDIMQATPISSAKRINIPAIVLSGSDDKTVPPVLSDEIYRGLVGPKMRLFFVGSHNSKRPTAVFEGIKFYLAGAMKGMSVAELFDSSFEFLKKDIIPEDNNIHGLPVDEKKEETAAKPTITTTPIIAPTEETILEEVREILSYPTTSPTQGKKKLNRSSSSTSRSKSPRDGQHQPPWNSKWEMSRETHNYGSNAHHIPQNLRRSTHTSIHSHVNTQRLHSEHHHQQNHHHHHQHQQKKSPRPSLHSIAVDNGNGIPRQLPIPSEETPPATGGGWIDVLGSIFWGTSSTTESSSSSPSPNQFPRPVEYAGSPAGSLGYLLHHLDSEICPPDASAWETVLLARAVEEIADAVINQSVDLASGLLEASLESTPMNLHTRAAADGDCRLLAAEGVQNSFNLALQLFQQVSAELGLGSIESSEARQWSNLLLLSPRELFEVIHTKDSEQDPEEEDEQGDAISPEDHSGRTSGENLSTNSSNPDEITSSTPLLSNKPTN